MAGQSGLRVRGLQGADSVFPRVEMSRNLITSSSGAVDNNMGGEIVARVRLKLLSLAATLAAVLLVTGCANPGGATATAQPKNIIIVFADGVAATQWELGRYSARVLRHRGFLATDVVFRQGALGLLATHSRDAFVTDSAAAASAMSTGVKVDNGALAMTPDGETPRTAMEAAKAAGKRIGLITTAGIYGASPAGFSVHAKSRTEAQAIVDQYLAMEPDVLIGGGSDYFLPTTVPGGRRNDGRDMIAAFAQKGYAIARDPSQLKNASSARLLALFAEADMSFDIDRDPKREPSMAEMAQVALDVLSRHSPSGFVLFVENDNADSAGHSNDAASVMRALWALDDTVQVALDFQKRAPNDTLIIITGDHETGGMSATHARRDLASTSASNHIFAGEDGVKMLGRITISFDAVDRALGKKPSADAVDQLVAQHFPGFNLDADLRDSIVSQKPLDRNFNYPTQNALGRMVARHTGFYWGTSEHTAEPVAVGALGPGAERFKGYQDNTEFAQHLQRLIEGR